MKEYVKPAFEMVELRAEERLACCKCNTGFNVMGNNKGKKKPSKGGKKHAPKKPSYPPSSQCGS